MFDRGPGNSHSRAYRVIRLGLVGCLLLLAAARLGGSFAVLDLINLAAAPLALASILIAALLLRGTRTWTGRLVLCLCCIPGILLLVPEKTTLAGCSPSAQKLRVAWINAHHPPRPDRIAAWLDAERPQIVGVAELRSDLSLREVLAKRYPHWQSCLRNGKCTTLVYSRLAPVTMEGLARGDPENRKALSAVGTEFAAPAVRIFAVHLSQPLPLGRQGYELRELEGRFEPAGDVIVMGDMNLSPRMRLLHDFAARNGLTPTLTDRPTWPIEIKDVPLPGFWQIDHLLVGRDWKVAAIRTGPDVGSDHKGFVADLCREAD